MPTASGPRSSTADAIKSIPAPAPLVEGLLDLDTLALLYGPSGCTKTFVALDVALSVATATWWHGSEGRGRARALHRRRRPRRHRRPG